MKAILTKLREIEEILEDRETTRNCEAWIIREAAELLAKLRVMFEAIVNDEEEK